jgi:hypothetical protein
MPFESMSDPKDVLTLVVRISAVGSLLSAAELLSLREEFRETGLFAWRISRRMIARRYGETAARGLGLLMSYPIVLLIPAIQVLVSLALCADQPASSAALALACGLVSACYAVLTIGGVQGYNGGDAMGKIIFLTAAIAFGINSKWSAPLALYFLTLQLCLSYLTPGAFRLFDRSWHSGRRLRGILRTEAFGRLTLWNFTRSRPWLFGLLSAGIVSFECTFLIAIVLPAPCLWYYLAAGTFFHVTNAIVMGLNTFVWTFVGLYPAVIWVVYSRVL